MDRAPRRGRVARPLRARRRWPPTLPPPPRLPWCWRRSGLRTVDDPHRSTCGGGPSTWPRTCSPGCRPIRRPTISSCATPWTPRKSRSGGGRATPATAKRRSTPTRTRTRRLRVDVPVTGRGALGCDPRGIHPRLGDVIASPDPHDFALTFALGLSARLRRLLMGPEPGGERKRVAAARHVDGGGRCRPKTRHSFSSLSMLGFLRCSTGRGSLATCSTYVQRGAEQCWRV